MEDIRTPREWPVPYAWEVSGEHVVIIVADTWHHEEAETRLLQSSTVSGSLYLHALQLPYFLSHPVPTSQEGRLVGVGCTVRARLMDLDLHLSSTLCQPVTLVSFHSC